jgi:hypothetical protein
LAADRIDFLVARRPGVSESASITSSITGTTGTAIGT